jgi:hypothetical protein
MKTNQTQPKPETVQASPQGLAPVHLFGFPELVANVKPGDRLRNAYSHEAEVIELLPNDPEYFARLRAPDGEEFAALAENFAAWKPEPNASDQTPAALDSANTTDAPSRLSASDLFVPGSSLD